MFFSNKTRISLIAIILAVFILGNFQYIDYVYAEETNSSLTPYEKAQLEEELARLQEEFNQIEAQLNSYKQQSAGYERDVAILESEIKKLQLQIRQNELVLSETSFVISINQKTLTQLEEKIKKQKELLSEIILGIYKSDTTSAIEIVFSSSSLSEFFNDIQYLKSIQEGLSDTLYSVKELKTQIEDEQIKLDTKIDTYSAIVGSQFAQRNTLDQKTQEQEKLLEASRTREYQQWLLAQNKQKSIQEVRSQLFRLEGAGIELSFGEAYDVAKVAASLTGIRPALLLSILKQESSWGKNVGQCFLHNKDNGDGIGVNTGTIYPRTMRATRRPGQAFSDVEAFSQITQELRRDLYGTRVSCWPQIYLRDGSPYGFGGAMGPAQFIPTTWLVHREAVSKILDRTADPWHIDDAFTASAYLLARNGATTQTYTAEKKAALIYYAGGNWSASVNQFYGNQVMARAAEYQKEIDIIEGR